MQSLRQTLGRVFAATQKWSTLGGHHCESADKALGSAFERESQVSGSWCQVSKVAKPVPARAKFVAQSTAGRTCSNCLRGHLRKALPPTVPEPG